MKPWRLPGWRAAPRCRLRPAFRQGRGGTGPHCRSGRLNIDYFLDEVMDEDRVDDIYDYFRTSETDDLETAAEELGGDYTEEEIRLVRVKFLSEMAN